MKLDEFEKQLDTLNIVEPTKNYLVEGNKILKKKVHLFNWNYAMAFSLSMSLIVNFWFFDNYKKSIVGESILITEKNNSKLVAQFNYSKYSIKYGASTIGRKNKNEIQIWERK